MNTRWLSLSRSVDWNPRRVQRAVITSIRNNEQFDLLEQDKQDNDFEFYTLDSWIAHYIL